LSAFSSIVVQHFTMDFDTLRQSLYADLVGYRNDMRLIASGGVPHVNVRGFGENLPVLLGSGTQCIADLKRSAYCGFGVPMGIAPTPFSLMSPLGEFPTGHVFNVRPLLLGGGGKGVPPEPVDWDEMRADAENAPQSLVILSEPTLRAYYTPNGDIYVVHAPHPQQARGYGMTEYSWCTAFGSIGVDGYFVQAHKLSSWERKVQDAKQIKLEREKAQIEIEKRAAKEAALEEKREIAKKKREAKYGPAIPYQPAPAEYYVHGPPNPLLIMAPDDAQHGAPLDDIDCP